MRRQEESSNLKAQLAGSSERQSSGEDQSDEDKIEELLTSDHKIQELHLSVGRLREFVATVGEEGDLDIPLCVTEYCDKLNQYRLKEGSSVIELAQRRVNKMLRNRKIKRNWNNEDITLLVWLVSKRINLLKLIHFSEFEKNDWEFISSLIAGSSWQKCKFKWLSLKKVRLNAHKWSQIQSKILTEAVDHDDKINWKLVSQKLYQKNPSKNKVFRTAKQCREHWNCFLNPNIHKGPWEIQEDRKLLQYVQQLEGSKKWSQIAKFMEGRTENALKNRFNLLLSTQRKISGQLTEKRLLKICLNRLILEEGQEERLEMRSPISERPEVVEESEPVVQFPHRGPLIPTVVEQPTFHSNIGFQRSSDENIVYCINNGLSNTMIPQPMMGQNIFFGFLFHGQFI